MNDVNYLINKYPRIFQDYEGNPGRCNWSCPQGWIDIVDRMCQMIQSHIDHINKWVVLKPEANKQPIQQLTCIQIKEKFGGLRFYVMGGDQFCEGIIRYVEELSYHVCESCGTNQNIGYTQGWISTVCVNCKDNYKQKWEPKKQ